MPLWLRLLLRVDGGIRTDVQDRLAAAGWVDAFRHLHPDDPGFTLPAVAPRIRLDYLLVPGALLPRVTVVRTGRRRAARGRASDHLPLVAEIERRGRGYTRRRVMHRASARGIAA